jgi:superfamily II DNA/RNA helicase
LGFGSSEQKVYDLQVIVATPGRLWELMRLGEPHLADPKQNVHDLQVIVATPGRLWELMRLGEPHLADLSRVAFLVLDEADRMVQQGHFQVNNQPQEPLR